jgi:hypothetical protein
MISHQHKCIFIHIPKTAGTSMEYHLCGGDFPKDSPLQGFDRCYGVINKDDGLGRGVWRHHLSLSQLVEYGISRCTWHPDNPLFRIDQDKYKKEYGDRDTEILESYFKFAFVRNPFDKFISEYNWRVESWGHQKNPFAVFEQREIPSFEDFILNIDNPLVYKDPNRTDEHFIPQSDFICLDDGEIGVDFVGRFENLQEDYGKVCERLKINLTGFPSLMRSFPTVSSGHYTPALKNKIRETFKADFDLFNYNY